MKKWAAALAAALLVPAAAGAVSPAELSDTSKYKPVYMSETGVVYAELASIKTGDPVKGQLPLIQADIYLERYRDLPDYETISGGGLVDHIFAYHTKLLAVHRMSDKNGPLQYYADNRLFGIFDADGSPANILPQAGEAQAITLTGEAQDLYLNLYRLL